MLKNVHNVMDDHPKIHKMYRSDIIIILKNLFSHIVSMNGYVIVILKICSRILFQ